MCLIIEKPAGMTVPDSYLVASAQHNRDGAGMAVYMPGQKVRLIKSPTAGLDFVRRMNTEFKDALVYLHMRMSTHGANSFENTHPVVIPNAPCALMHNGVLYNYGDQSWDWKGGYGWHAAPDSKSDTRDFAETLLGPMFQKDPECWDNPGVHHLIEDYIGSDKMVLLGAFKAVVLNRGKGVVRDGIWYSNEYSLVPYTYHKPKAAVTTLATGGDRQEYRKNSSEYIYKKPRKLRKREMRECEYRDVCGCAGLCAMLNQEEALALGQLAPGGKCGVPQKDEALERDMRGGGASVPANLQAMQDDEAGERAAARADVEAALCGTGAYSQAMQYDEDYDWRYPVTD